jgi:hypothetical protein
MLVRQAPARFATAIVIAFALAASGSSASAQEPPDPVAAAGERWLASDQTSREQLNETVRTLLREPTAGIAWLAKQLPESRKAPAEPRSKGVGGLVTHLTLAFLRRQRATDISYVGQFAALQPLQPEVSELLFTWMTATPDWYPYSHRIHLVAPMRDLCPQMPPPERLEAIVQIVENASIEPEDLRRGLATVLWLWGEKKYGKAVIESLQAATVDGDAEDRVQATLDLADFHNQLREYKAAAMAHRSAQTLAKGAGVTLKPMAWYAAACVHALAGDVEQGLAAMTACADLLASPDLDPSLRLPRAMFATDPELEPLRTHPRWSELVQRACLHAPPPKPTSEPRSGESKTGR